MGDIISDLSETFDYDQRESNSFPKIFRTKKNLLYLNMENRNSELYVSCYYEKYFRKYTFSKTFSLENFKREYPLFDIYSSFDRIINELRTKKIKLIEGDEENSNSINIIISTNLTEFPSICLSLNRVNLSTSSQLGEKERTITRYELRNRIFGLDESQIFINKDEEKMLIKSWISPNKILKAKLLYSYYIGEINSHNDEIVLKMPGYGKQPKKFHEACDNRNNILIICKSKDEIFGGYTPLCFDSSNEDKSDKKSFLFSLNKREKYIKDPKKKSKSIFCYKNYGPCFCEDLFFLKYYINIVSFNRNEFLTEVNWVDQEKCYMKCDKVLLDKIEIFQIEEINFNNDDYINIYNRINNNHNNNNINRTINNNHNNNNINRSNNHNNSNNNSNNNRINNNNNNNDYNINNNSNNNSDNNSNNNSNNNNSNNNRFSNNNNISNRINNSNNINNNRIYSNNNNNNHNNNNSINNNRNSNSNNNHISSRINNNNCNNDITNHNNTENSCRNRTGNQINRNANNNRINNRETTVINISNPSENNLSRRDNRGNQTEQRTEEISDKTTSTANPIAEYLNAQIEKKQKELRIAFIDFLSSDR